MKFQILLNGLAIEEVLIPDTSELPKNFLVIYAKQNYNYEIITGLHMKDIEFFNFIRLFETWVFFNFFILIN